MCGGGGGEEEEEKVEGGGGGGGREGGGTGRYLTIKGYTLEEVEHRWLFEDFPEICRE